jgi:hypothetical protein
LFSRDVAKDALYESAKVKSKAWSYEGEYRLFTIRKLCEERKMEGSFTTTPEHFLDFRRAWVRSVDFGVRCPPHEVQRVVDLVKSEYQNVILRKAQFHKTEYALDYTNI